jgi:hypothetical protein
MGTIHSQLSVLTASLCFIRPKQHLFFIRRREYCLLHHQWKVLAETVVFVSGSGLGCCLVVAIVQPTRWLRRFLKAEQLKPFGLHKKYCANPQITIMLIET